MRDTNITKVDENKKIKKCIGIMGGTFDPIHYGHLVTAEIVRADFKLDSVIFVPSGRPPHKLDQKVTDPEHRYRMTCLATQSNPYFEVSREEIDRAGYTYTIDTIKRYSELYNGEAEFYFITGADVVNQILTWKEPESLLKMCEFIAVNRGGYKTEALFKDVENLSVNYGSKIHLMQVPLLDISSTAIRKRVSNGQTIKYLLPETVEAYILEKNIYCE